MNIIDKPLFLEKRLYDEVFEKLRDFYSRNNDVLDVYRIGSVSNPGISDLDVMLIVKDEKSFDFMDFKTDNKERLLLTHNPFIISEKFVERINSFSPYFSEFRNTEAVIRKQVAFEFLLKFFISLTIQINLKTIKLRNFLLEVKASKEDFEILGVYKSVSDLIGRFIELRNNYFDKEFNKKNFINNLFLFYNSLRNILSELSVQKGFNFGNDNNYDFMRNVELNNSSNFNVKVRGFFPIKNIVVRNRKLFNFVNSFYNYTFCFKWQSIENNGILKNMYYTQKEVFKYHKNYFKNFICPVSPLFIDL